MAPSGPRLHIDIPKESGRKRIVVWFYADWTSSGNMFICESWIVARGMMDYVLLKLFFLLSSILHFQFQGCFTFGSCELCEMDTCLCWKLVEIEANIR